MSFSSTPGNDTYYFNKGDGEKAFDLGAGSDTVILGSGITPKSALSIVQVMEPINQYEDEWDEYPTNSITIDFGPGIGKLTLTDCLDDTAIPTLKFQDGTVWDKAYFKRLIELGRTIPFDTYLQGTTKLKVLTGGKGDDLLVAANVATRLVGNEGKDWLEGGAANDTLLGGSGNDYLVGGAGNDSLDGGADIDSIYGGAGNDIILGGAGNDLIWDNEGANKISGGEGDDYMLASGTLNGDAGNDDLNALGSNNKAYGGIGNDEIDAFEGSGNLLDGGVGNDALSIYNYGASGGTNTLLGGAGNDTLRAGSSSDLLQGGDGDDLLIVGYGLEKGGRDTLEGGKGGDTYRIATTEAGSNQEVLIVENDKTKNVTDSLQFAGYGLDQNLIWFKRSGNDLLVTDIYRNNTATLQDWFKGAAYQVEKIELAVLYEENTASKKTLLGSDVNALVNAMAAFQPPPAGSTSLSAEQAAALTPLIAASWH